MMHRCIIPRIRDVLDKSFIIITVIIIIYIVEWGHLLTRSGLTYPEVSSKVFHDSFWQLENSRAWGSVVVKALPN